MKTEVRRGRKFVEYIDDSLPVGTFVQEIGAHDVSYQDEGRLWHQLVEDWEVDGQDGFSFRASRMNHKVRFDSLGAWRWYPRRNVETEYIIINRPQCWLTRTNRWGYLLANGISREGKDITITSLRNVTRVVHSHWNGIKTDWILENENAPTRFQQQIDIVGLTEVDGWLYGADGEQVARLTPTIAIDAEGNELPTSTSYENGILEFSADVTGAVYPVTIDPDFASGASFGYVNGYDSGSYTTAHSTAYGSSNAAIRIGQRYISGYYVWRAFLQFDTSSIPDTDTVTQVNLRMVCTTNGSATDFDVQIVKYNWSAQDPLATNNREAAYDGCLAAPADDSIWLNTAGISTKTQYTSGNLSTAWVNKTGTTYYGLRSDRDVSATMPSAGEYLDLATPTNATTSYRPVLVVTYEAGSQTLTLTCAAGSYSLTGTNVTLTHTPASQNLTLACNAGSYSLTGTNADLTVKRNYVLACGAGSYALTGTNADLTVKRNYVLTCGAGSYTLTGTDADFVLLRNYILACGIGSYALTGTNAGLTSARTMALESGSYALTGTNADFYRALVMACNSGSYSLTGSDVTLDPTFHYSLICEPGSYTLTGSDISFAVQRNYTFACEAGSYSLTGTATTFEVKRNYVLACSAGSYSLTGTDTTLSAQFHYSLVCEAGSYTYTGTDISFGNTKSYTLVCSAGSYNLTGSDLAFEVKRNYSLTIEAGSYSLTGTDISFVLQRNFTLALESGSYALTGTNTGLTSARTIALASGSYALTGTNASLFKGLVLPCASGTYSLTGSDATLNANYVFALGMGSYVLVGTSVGLFILSPTPACRTATIEYENRTFAIPHENRTATIEYENRTLEVKCH